jgi:hypothetical protein
LRLAHANTSDWADVGLICRSDRGSLRVVNRDNQLALFRLRGIVEERREGVTEAIERA